MPKNGEWIDGKQYWDGKYGEAGVVMNPNDVGYGKKVSSEVNRASSIAQGKEAGAIDAYLGNTVVNNQQSDVVPTNDATQQAGAFNLINQYDQLKQESGIDKLTASISEKEKMLAEAESQINDNPWNSESTRVGRIAKLRETAGNEINNLKNDLSTAMNNINTKLNLQSQQYEINTSQSADALKSVESYLSLGLLDNANEMDITALAQKTGVSPALIRSAIAARKSKLAADAKFNASQFWGNLTGSNTQNSTSGNITSLWGM